MKEKVNHYIEKYKPYINKNKRLLIVFFCAILAFFLLFWWLSPVPTEFRSANVHARSVSVGWVNTRAGWGCVGLWKGPSISARQTGARSTQDDKLGSLSLPSLSITCDWNMRDVHLVEVTDLEPENQYRIWLLSGFRPFIWNTPTVTTQTVQAEMPGLPKPAYGSVVHTNGDKKAGALVYVFTQSALPQYPAAALTNGQGNYAVDLSNLPLDGRSFIIDAYVSAEDTVRLEIDDRISTPFPPLVVGTGESDLRLAIEELRERIDEL